MWTQLNDSDNDPSDSEARGTPEDTIFFIMCHVFATIQTCGLFLCVI